MFWKHLKWLLWPAVGAVLAALSIDIGKMTHVENGAPVWYSFRDESGEVLSAEEVTLYVEVLGLTVYEQPGPADPTNERRRAFWWLTPMALALGGIGGVGLHALLHATCPHPRTPTGWRAIPVAPRKGAILKGFFKGVGAVYLLFLGWGMAQAFLRCEYAMFSAGAAPRTLANRLEAAMFFLVLGGILVAPIVAIFGGVMVAVAIYRGVSLRCALGYGVGGLVSGLLFGLVMYFIYPYAPHRVWEQTYYKVSMGFPDALFYDVSAYSAPFMLIALMGCAVIARPRQFAVVPVDESLRPSAPPATEAEKGTFKITNAAPGTSLGGDVTSQS